MSPDLEIIIEAHSQIIDDVSEEIDERKASFFLKYLNSKGWFLLSRWEIAEIQDMARRDV